MIKRYSISDPLQEPESFAQEHPEGEWIKWEDYNTLEEDFKELGKENDRLLNELWKLENAPVKSGGYHDVEEYYK